MCNYYIYIYLITSTKHQTLALPRDNRSFLSQRLQNFKHKRRQRRTLAALFVCSLVFISSSFPSEAHFPSYLSLTPPISRTASDRRRQTVSSRSLPGANVPCASFLLLRSFRLPVRIVFCSSKTSPSLAPKSPFVLFLSSRQTYRNTFGLTIVRENRKSCSMSSYAASYLPRNISRAFSSSFIFQETKVFLLLATDASETCSSTRQTRSRRPRKYRRGSEPISRRFHGVQIFLFPRFRRGRREPLRHANGAIAVASRCIVAIGTTRRRKAFLLPARDG